jgi:hypothetical protein
VAEAHPCYIPPNDETLGSPLAFPTHFHLPAPGLRPVHVLGLAHVLHRPIILLDKYVHVHSASVVMASRAHEEHGLRDQTSGIYLPLFLSPQDYQNDHGTPYQPLLIAWSRSVDCPQLSMQFYRPCKLLSPSLRERGSASWLRQYLPAHGCPPVRLECATHGARPACRLPPYPRGINSAWNCHTVHPKVSSWFNMVDFYA